MKLWVVAGLFISAPVLAASGPRVLTGADIDTEAVEDIQNGDGPTYREHPGEMVRFVCDAADRRLSNCRALVDWAAFLAPRITRVKVSAGISGPIQINFRLR